MLDGSCGPAPPTTDEEWQEWQQYANAAPLEESGGVVVYDNSWAATTTTSAMPEDLAFDPGSFAPGSLPNVSHEAYLSLGSSGHPHAVCGLGTSS